MLSVCPVMVSFQSGLSAIACAISRSTGSDTGRITSLLKSKLIPHVIALRFFSSCCFDRRLVVGIGDANQLDFERIVLLHVLSQHPRQHERRIGIIQDVSFGGLIAGTGSSGPASSCIFDH